MPLVPPLPNPLSIVEDLNDSLAKDEKLPLSAIVAQSGWTGNDAEIARAVALAESSGKKDAVSWTGCCVGLWQINAEVHNGKYGLPSDVGKAKDALKDPILNGKVAYQLWRDSGGWGPWDGYTNGAYRRYLNPKGHDPLITVQKNSVSGTPVEAAGDVLDTVTKPVEVAAKSLELAGDVVSALFNPSTYMRIGKGWLGGILLITGTGALVFIVANKASNGAVADTAGKAVKVATIKKV